VVVSTLNTPFTSFILEFVWKRFLKEVSIFVRMTDFRFSRFPAAPSGGAGGLDEPAVGVDAS